MKILTSFVVISLLGLVISAPSNDDNDKFTITKSMYKKARLKYLGSHEIVNLLYPINSLNFDQNDSSESDSKSNESDSDDVILFFVEADIDSEGKRIDQGLYVLKKGKVTKLLDHGRDAAASGDDSTQVFFGAADGIYVNNKEKNSAEKYGTVNDSIIGITKELFGDVIYILTENHEVYNVSNEDDKKAYVRTPDGVKKIEGLPENPSSVTLVKPFFTLEEAVGFVVDNVVYVIYANGSSESVGIEFTPKAKPSAYSPEAGLMEYYAIDKKIYEFNLLAMRLSDGVDELKEFLNEKEEDIKSISKTSRYSHRKIA